MTCVALRPASLKMPARVQRVSEKTEQFPRSTTIPKQSPVFWVGQKDRYLRQLLIRGIENLTGRRLLTYYANRFHNAQINQRDCDYFVELFGDVKGAPCDLFIETPGGETDATEGLVRLIRNLAPDLRVIVPNAAKSNGTLLSLAAREIVMGPSSELGPIEPHLANIPSTVLMEPEMAQQNFPLHKLGTYAYQHSKQIAFDLLSSGMMASRTRKDVEAVVEKLASRDTYKSHGAVIDHQEASNLGLSICYLPDGDEVWARIWLLYCMYDFDTHRSGLLKIYEGRSRSTQVPLSPATS